MELIFEVFITEPETGVCEFKRFNNVRQAYEYASQLKSLGFEPYIVHYFAVKV